MVYLDNSSTTAVCKESAEALKLAVCDNFGNPSSLHSLGIKAELAVSEVRKKLSRLLNCREDEIYFISCATEGNNTCIEGAARRNGKLKKKIVTTAVEHPSVLNTVKRLSQEGFEAVFAEPDKSGGAVSAENIFSKTDENTVLVSMMAVNNETGAVMPVAEAAKMIKKAYPDTLIHCDAVQAFGKIPLDVKKLGIDMLTLSGHKFHAPKGIGAMYIKKGVKIRPLMAGGGQERDIRPGTESVPLICALGGALDALANFEKRLPLQKELWTYTKDLLLKENGVIINSGEDSLPYILNISLPGFRSETLLHFLDAEGIFVSSGSACSKGKGSYVLKACGVSDINADSALRISFSRYSKKEDADKLSEALKSAAQRLRRSVK